MVSDSPSYWEPAVSLAQGKGYSLRGEPTAVRTPGYPAFLASIVFFAGPSVPAALLAQVVVAACLGPGLAWWIHRRGFSKKTALGVGLLVALDPALIGAAAVILSETLGAVLLTGTVIVLGEALTHPRWPRWVLVGLLAGAVGLNTPNTLAMLPFLCIFLMLVCRHRPPIRLLLKWSLAMLLAVACLGAWTVRNRLVLGNLVPVRSVGFASLVWGVTEYEYRWLPDPDSPEFKRFMERFEHIRAGREMYQAEGDFWRAALQNLRQQPLTTLARVARANFWFWLEIPGAVRVLSGRTAIRWGLLAFHQLQLLGFLAAVVLLWRDRTNTVVALGLGCAAYFALSLMLLFPIPRYYIPVLPIMNAIAGVGLLGWWERRCPADNRGSTSSAGAPSPGAPTRRCAALPGI